MRPIRQVSSFDDIVSKRLPREYIQKLIHAVDATRESHFPTLETLFQERGLPWDRWTYEYEYPTRDIAESVAEVVRLMLREDTEGFRSRVDIRPFEWKIVDADDCEIGDAW